MTQLTHFASTTDFLPAASVLVMSDRLITLALEADRAGYSATAERLLYLAHEVFDEKHPAVN